MKGKRTAASLGLVLAVLASMVVLTATALGETKRITFSEPMTIGGVTLKAGFYSIKWEGTGPEVQVTFKRDGETVATAPARLVSEKNPNGRSIETFTNPDESKELKRISFHDEALIFDVSEAGATAR